MRAFLDRLPASARGRVTLAILSVLSFFAGLQLAPLVVPALRESHDSGGSRVAAGTSPEVVRESPSALGVEERPGVGEGVETVAGVRDGDVAVPIPAAEVPSLEASSSIVEAEELVAEDIEAEEVAPERGTENVEVEEVEEVEAEIDQRRIGFRHFANAEYRAALSAFELWLDGTDDAQRDREATDEVFRYVIEASRRLEDPDVERATRYAETLLARQPESLDHLLLLAEILEEFGQEERLATLSVEARARGVKDPRIEELYERLVAVPERRARYEAARLMVGANSAFDEFRFEEALDLAGQSLELQDSPEARVLRLRAASRAEDWWTLRLLIGELRSRRESGGGEVLVEMAGETAPLSDWVTFFTIRLEFGEFLESTDHQRHAECEEAIAEFLGTAGERETPIHDDVARAFRGACEAYCDRGCESRIDRVERVFRPIRRRDNAEFLILRGRAYLEASRSMPEPDHEERAERILELWREILVLRRLIVAEHQETKRKRKQRRRLAGLKRELAEEMRLRRDFDAKLERELMKLYGEIVDDLRRALRLSAGDATRVAAIEFLLGQCHRARGRASGREYEFRSASRRFRNARGAGLETLELFEAWGDACEEFGDHRGAGEALHEAYKLAPTKSGCLRAVKCYWIGKEEEKAFRLNKEGSKRFGECFPWPPIIDLD